MKLQNDAVLVFSSKQKTKLAWFSRLSRHLTKEMRWAYSTMLLSPHGA